jgi:hypothetical protein
MNNETTTEIGRHPCNKWVTCVRYKGTNNDIQVGITGALHQNESNADGALREMREETLLLLLLLQEGQDRFCQVQLESEFIPGGRRRRAVPG